MTAERYQRIIEWQQDERYEEVPYEALYRGGDPEGPDPPTGHDIDDPALANGARIQLPQAGPSVDHLGIPRTYNVYQLLHLVHDFRHEVPGALEALAKAIRWRPGNDPDTGRRFGLWRRALGAQPGEPDAYTQLVMQALLLMKLPKDGLDSLRDETPQPVRLGRHWVPKKKGKIQPRALAIASYLQWFRNEVTRIIKHEILPETEDLSRARRGRRGTAENSCDSASTDARHARTWRDASRAHRDSLLSPEEAHPLDTLTDTSSRLRTLGRQALDRGLRLSPLQRDILDLAAANARLADYQDVAEHLGRSRDTVKNAITRLHKQLR